MEQRGRPLQAGRRRQDPQRTMRSQSTWRQRYHRRPGMDAIALGSSGSDAVVSDERAGEHADGMFDGDPVDRSDLFRQRRDYGTERNRRRVWRDDAIIGGSGSNTITMGGSNDTIIGADGEANFAATRPNSDASPSSGECAPIR